MLSGEAYCTLFANAWPGSTSVEKIKKDTGRGFYCKGNCKLLETAVKKVVEVQENVWPVQELAKGSFNDHLQFCRWSKSLHDAGREEDDRHDAF